MKCKIHYEGRLGTANCLFIHIVANFLYIVAEKFEWSLGNLTFCSAIDLVLAIPVIVSFLWPKPFLLAPLASLLPVTGLRNGYLIFISEGFAMGLVSLMFPFYFSFLLLQDARGLRARERVDPSEVKSSEEADKELRNMFEGLGRENQCIDLPGGGVV